MLVSACLSNLAETIHQSAQFGSLSVSASNVFGQVGPAFMVYFWLRQVCEVWGQGPGGRRMPLAVNGWLGQLVWFPTQMRLRVLLNFPNRLSGWQRPGATLSLGYG